MILVFCGFCVGFSLCRTVSLVVVRQVAWIYGLQ